MIFTSIDDLDPLEPNGGRFGNEKKLTTKKDTLIPQYDHIIVFKKNMHLVFCFLLGCLLCGTFGFSGTIGKKIPDDFFS
jgi:hypothetical protein